MKSIFIILILISLNSFAMTAKEARSASFIGIIFTNDTRIDDASNAGECDSELYMPSSFYPSELKKIQNHYKRLGYKIIEEFKISWCE